MAKISYETEEKVKEADPDTLQDLSRAGIQKLFHSLVQKHSDRLAASLPTLKLLKNLIADLQDAGLEHIGIEIANRKNLSEYGRRVNKLGDVFLILTIYDTHFLVRVPVVENSIDLHKYNLLNNSSDRSIDSDRFWQENNTPLFDRFNLKDADEKNLLAETIIKAAAICKASADLSEYDLPPRSSAATKFKKDYSP